MGEQSEEAARKEEERQEEVAREAIKSIRETAKFIAGGAGAAGAVVLASVPLTGLGKLDFGFRALFALVGIGAGFIALGRVLWRALDVIAPRTLTLQKMLEGKDKGDKGVAKYIEKTLVRFFPKGLSVFEKIRKGKDERFAEHIESELAHLFPDVPKEDELAQLFPDGLKTLAAIRNAWNDPATRKRLALHLIDLVPAAQFEEVRYRFLQLRNALLYLVPVIALGFGLFAWAVSAPKEKVDVLTRPRIATVGFHPHNASVAQSVWGISRACVRNTLQVIILAVHPSGIKDAVTVPTDDCPPVSLQVLDKEVVLLK